MTTVEANASPDPNLIFTIIVYVATVVAAIITVIIAILKFSLKIGNDFESSYIDADSNVYIEFRIFKIKLGFSIRSVKLPKKFDRNSDVKLWYKPANGFRRELVRDNYDFDLGKKDKKVKLTDKEILKSREIELIRSKMTKSLDAGEISEYQSKIQVNFSNNVARIENSNDVEIQNYSFYMPETVRYEDASFYFQNENILEINAILHEEDNVNEHLTEPRMKIIIKKIPSLDEHDRPGIVTIPLPTESPS